MNPEQEAMRNLDNRPPDEHPVIVESYKKAERMLAEEALDPVDFVDHYGQEQVDRDLKEVSEIKRTFETNDTKHTATVLEAIMYEHAELSEWLGNNVETIKTSEYDDVINGVDLIAEFSQDGRPAAHLALAIDVTFGTRSMEEKFGRIEEEIEKDELASIKYFEAHGFKGRLQQRPRIIIGAEHETVKELAALWNNDKKKELGEHHIRHMLFNEIREQLETYSKYAEKHNKPKATRSYEEAIKMLQEVRTPKQTPNELEKIEKDRVYQEIRSQLSRFKS